MLVLLEETGVPGGNHTSTASIRSESTRADQLGWLGWSKMRLYPSVMMKYKFLTLQVTMFISRLSGAPIGLTAFNVFVVDKATILTVSTERRKTGG